MKPSEIDKWIERGYDVKVVNKWECPDGVGVPLITMPNVPKPLHGVNPRTIIGQPAWNVLRKQCYYNANYCCEICGDDPEKRNLHSHELYSYDYKRKEAVFERAIAVCAVCHNAIHSGRLITMFTNKNPLYPKSYVLRVVEQCFSLVHEYNKTHSKSLRVFATYLNYLEKPELENEMERLIRKYDISFYVNKGGKNIGWGKWKLAVGNKVYKSPYNSQSEWQAVMDQKARRDTDRKVKNNFKGEVYDEIDAILREQE